MTPHRAAINAFNAYPRGAPDVTPQEFQAIRKRLDLTQAQLAKVLGYAHAAQVASFESNAKTTRVIPPLLERLMLAYDAGYRPSDWPN
jgi:transcriptional regulator with XRE-family HTH domain